ncbi:uncharacterized protein LOC128992285 [Macrosteles quadrilineatus]|uniref:uncharacterized protein LOC128992285 n=1 Tax=Macrosteles quadrilineatus TaxID=74068 RepID=UPI0023E1457A|nr:uncharacterized protein LOC128992285 [Macrosteles quadrilineatus]XP_054271752.1 uncharacterized protein LOC128992285 [Macrosteles quadrilineatus]XP_054271754.1 uncharacterized protein LOC128992285 [Macrosteles quadrilineatus]
MALTILPEEVLELIVGYFSVKDLLSCSAVSLAWRERFNADVFWKRFCIKSISNYLENVQSLVKPVFTMPLENEERLQPLCEWRIRYMRQTHLINNWKGENFLISDFRSYVGVISAEVKIDFEGTHWLFVRTTTELEIWNIHNDPILHSTIALFGDCAIINIFLAERYVLVTQWNVLSIYDLRSSGTSIKAKSRCILEEDKPLPPTLWEVTDKTDINLINEDDDFRYCQFGSMIVGYKRIPNPLTDLTMHIWEINTGGKVKYESMWKSLFEGYEIAFTNIFRIDDNKGLIRMVFIDVPRVLHSQIFVYDFKKLKFKETNITFDGVVVWCGCTQNIIVTFTSHPGIIKFYGYTSGKLLAVKEIGEYTNSEQMQLVGSYLLYCMFNCMNVMDIHNREIVYCVEFSFYSFVRRLSVIEPRFVVVWLLQRGGSPGCPVYYQEVWDIKDLSNKLLQCSGEQGFEMAASSPSPIKQVICADVTMSVYTFW